MVEGDERQLVSSCFCHVDVGDEDYGLVAVEE
jgi:hypothetical protein